MTNYTVKSTVVAGNNYGSLILRVKINYQKQTKRDNKQHFVSLVVKTPLVGGNIEQLKEVTPDLYQIEPRFYGKYIVETHKHMNHNTVPRYYTSPYPQCVVLEDLIESGYKMVDRQKLLDFDHCQLYIKASAKLHALSIVVNSTNPELVQSLVNQNPEVEKAMEKVFKSMVTNSLRCMAAYIKDKPTSREYFDVITAFVESDKCWSTLVEMDKYDQPLKALTQGDPWCTNMTFKYTSSGKVQDIKLLDFEHLKFISQVFNLAFVIVE